MTSAPSESSRFSRVIDILSGASRWIVLCHVHPDGDALGSASALVSAAKGLGKTVAWGGPDIVPSNYMFLPFTEEYRPGLDLRSPPPDAGTAVVALDTSTRARSVDGIASLPPSVHLVNLDHHVDNEMFGTVNYIDVHASSTGEIVWMLIDEWGLQLNTEALEALYTAIVSDCGNFSFSCTSARTHRVAANLLDSGVCPAKINDLLRSSATPQALHLRGIALSRAFVSSGFAAFTWLRRQDFENTGSDPSDSDSINSDLFTLRGVSFSALFTEDDGYVRVSLRSRGAVEAAEIARSFGGGGHRQAAGCLLELSLPEAVRAIQELVEKTYAERTSASK